MERFDTPLTSSPDDDTSPPNLSRGSRTALTAFSLIFLAVGIIVTSLIINSFSKAIAQHSWPTTDCVITRSAIDDNQKPSQPNYRFDVAFTYAIAGEQITATQLRTDYTGASDYYDAQKLHDAYPVGSHATCWFDSKHPQTAVLQRSGLLIGFAALIPLVFVAIGVSGLYFSWFSSRLQRQPTPPSQKKKNAGKAIFAVFLIVGVSLLVFVFTPMLLRGRQAATWPQVPCTIVHSAISSHTGNKGGTTYGVEVLYRYQFDGKSYASSKYGFMSSSSSNYYGKQDIVRSLPPRKKTVCFVNPNDPAYAVLDRSYESILLFALIPLAFAIIGTAGVVGAFRTAAAPTPTIIPGSMIGTVPISKKPQTPGSALIAAFILAAFWNGIVSIFVNQLIVEWKHGNHDYFLAVFLVPFVFVGTLLIVHLGYRIVKCF